MKKFISLLLVMMLAFAMTACGGGAQGGGEEDGQNPIMNYVGTYVCGRASIDISADDSKDATSAVVRWSSSAAENSEWTMSGSFDADSKTFTYTGGTRTNYVYGEDGEIASQEEVYTDGSGTMTFADGDKLTLTWKDDKEDVAKDMVFEFATLPEEGEEAVGMANPWTEADSLAAAAEGAGLDGFDVAEGSQISLGEIKGEHYRYMDGIAEITFPIAAVEMTIRKGTTAAAPDGDVSGDYNEYAHNWEQNIKGLTVQCFGNREGEATKTIWTSGDYSYAILAYGAGGDDDFGLSADDLNSLINGIQ